MKATRHFIQRIKQRAISKKAVELAYRYGRMEKDRIILDRKIIRWLIEESGELRKDLIKLMERGGITLVVDGDQLITGYGCER
jgi:hypothetical protein